MNKNISELTISELAKQFRCKKLSPVDVTKYMLQRAKQSQQTINAFNYITEDRALQEAKSAEERLMSGEQATLLTGIPYSVKDLIHAKNAPTTLSCEAYKDRWYDFDATVIELLTQAGAVLLGKANTSELALSASADKGGSGAIRNPRNIAYVGGGSSTGSAAAVAAGMSVFSIGTDQGGSCRIPASCCGVVGMKPTHGLISYYGTAESSELLDHLGILCKSVSDCASVLSVVSGPDKKYWASYKKAPVDYAAYANKPIGGLTVAVSPLWAETGTEDFVLKNYQQSVDTLKELGAHIVEVDLSLEELAAYRQCHQEILLAGAYCNHREIFETVPDLIDPEVYDRLRTGKGIPAWRYYSNVKIRRKAISDIHDKLKGIDALVTPTLQVVPPKQLQRECTVDGKTLSVYSKVTHFTWLGNLTGMPAITVPNGYDDNNLPSGFQIIGKLGEDEKVIQIAAAHERVWGMLDTVTELPQS